MLPTVQSCDASLFVGLPIYRLLASASLSYSGLALTYPRKQTEFIIPRGIMNLYQDSRSDPLDKDGSITYRAHSFGTKTHPSHSHARFCTTDDFTPFDCRRYSFVHRVRFLVPFKTVCIFLRYPVPIPIAHTIYGVCRILTIAPKTVSKVQLRTGVLVRRSSSGVT